MNILEEANKLVGGDRQKVYSHPKHDFKLVTDMAAPMLASDKLSPEQKHALYMILVKVARLCSTPDHHDSIVDIAGYAQTYAMLSDELS